MSWVTLSLLTAIFAAARDYHSKKHLSRLHPLTVSWALSLLSVPFLSLALLFAPAPNIDSSFWFYVCGSAIFLAAGWILYIKALSLSEMSLTIPLISLSPLFLLILAPIFLGELPSFVGCIGVLLIVAGTYTLGLSRASEGFLGPLRALLREPGPRLMLCAAVVLSVIATFEKAGISRSAPIPFALAENTCVALIMIPILYFSHPEGFRETLRELKVLLPIGFFVAMMFICQASAMQFGPVTYVVAIKRTSILFSVIAGGVLLRESRLAVKLIGSVIILAGIMAIAAG